MHAAHQFAPTTDRDGGGTGYDGIRNRRGTWSAADGYVHASCARNRTRPTKFYVSPVPGWSVARLTSTLPYFVSRNERRQPRQSRPTSTVTQVDLRRTINRFETRPTNTVENGFKPTTDELVARRSCRRAEHRTQQRSPSNGCSLFTARNGGDEEKIAWAQGARSDQPARRREHTSAHCIAAQDECLHPLHTDTTTNW